MTVPREPRTPEEALAAALRKVRDDMDQYEPFLAPYGIEHNTPLVLAALEGQP